jgi:pyruvate kinase
MRKRHARILATVGPASNNLKTLEKLVEAGADAFRLNFSHGDHEDKANIIKYIREVEKKRGYPIAILQDLQGPKIRLGMFKDDMKFELKTGDRFTIDSSEELGDKTRCQLPHPEILEVLKEGDKIYINDGTVRLEVVEAQGDAMICEVTDGGTVSSRKGVNLPGVELPISSITKKDWTDLDFGLEQGVDWVAISFVQRADDIHAVRKKAGDKVAIMAKIETPGAVERIDEIIEAADAIMVARGDLGVEVPLQDVPVIQKKLIRRCREVGKPVVVATQMLESMITNAMPTRAEVTDVANATYEGADALMLSAESAAGNYPIKAVQTMNDVICRAEQSSDWQPLMEARHIDNDATASDAITNAAYYTAEVLQATGIVTFTESGSTALRMSRQRPVCPIIALTEHENIARRLVLGWGLNCHIAAKPTNQEDLEEIALDGVKYFGLGRRDGDKLVLTAGLPFGQTGTTNLLRVVQVNGEAD